VKGTGKVVVDPEIARIIAEMEADPARWRRALANVHDLLPRAEKSVLSFLPSGPVSVAGLDRAVIALQRRSVRLFRAVRILLDDGLAEEAFIVARTLFTESLWMGEFYEAGSVAARARLVAGWLQISIDEVSSVFLESERIGWGYEGWRGAFTTRRQSIREAADNAGGIGKYGHFPSEKQMVERQSPQADYIAFLTAHQMTHGSEVSLIFRSDPVGESGTDESEPLVAGYVGAFAARSLLMGFDYCARIFGWSGRDEIAKLLEELNQSHVR
jgi:hypothetical protein